MVYNIYSIHDCVADEYGPLFNCKNDEVAKRAVKSILTGDVNPFDYEIFCLGTFDSDNGVLVPEKRLAFIGHDILGEVNVNE